MLTAERALAKALDGGLEVPDTKYANEDYTLAEVIGALAEYGWPITRVEEGRLGRAAYEWWSTTHGDSPEHDHHCAATIWHHGQRVTTNQPCTCGWGAFEDALNLYALAIGATP